MRRVVTTDEGSTPPDSHGAWTNFGGPVSGETLNMNDTWFALLLIPTGLIPLYFAYRAVKTGVVRHGDQVSKQSYTREESPGSFWCGVAFYTLMAVGLMVAGGLVATGVIE